MNIALSLIRDCKYIFWGFRISRIPKVHNFTNSRFIYSQHFLLIFVSGIQINRFRSEQICLQLGSQCGPNIWNSFILQSTVRWRKIISKRNLVFGKSCPFIVNINGDIVTDAINYLFYSTLLLSWLIKTVCCVHVSRLLKLIFSVA